MKCKIEWCDNEASLGWDPCCCGDCHWRSKTQDQLLEYLSLRAAKCKDGGRPDLAGLLDSIGREILSGQYLAQNDHLEPEGE